MQLDPRINAFCFECTSPTPLNWTTGNESLDSFIMESWSNMTFKYDAYKMEHSGTCSMSLNGTSHYVMEADQHALASFLTGLGVLELIGDTTVSKTFKITSPYIEMIARKRILSNFDCTLSPGDNIEPPLSQSGLLDPISLLKTALRFFNKNIMLLAPTRTWYMWMALWVSRSLEKVCTIRSCIGSCCPG